jgi:CHAT domain-containing protein
MVNIPVAFDQVLVKSLIIVVCLTAFMRVGAQPYAVVIERDTTDYAFSVLDGENVSLYADLSLLRKTSKYNQSFAADVAGELWNIEKNFRWLGNMWMAQHQLNTLVGKLSTPGNRLELKIFTRAISDLGFINHHLGLYKKSETSSAQALNWRSRYLGKYNMATICSMNNLGALYRDMGQYDKAMTLLSEAEEILKSKAMSNTMEYAIVQNNQAMLFIALGQYEKAQQVLDAAIATADKFTGDKSKDFLAFQGNKALLLHAQKKYADAEIIFLNIKGIKEGRLGKKNAQYARTLNNLASLYLEMGRISEVEPLLISALEIYKKEFGENHPITTSIMSNLGKYYWFTGKLPQAESTLLNAQRVQNYILNKFHADVISTANMLALTFWEMGKIAEASNQFKKVRAAILEQVSTYFPALTDLEKTIFWAETRPYLMKYYTFVMRNHKTNPELVSDMYAMHLATKGLLLSISTKVKKQILNSGDSLLMKKYDEWLVMKNDLAGYYALPRMAVIQMGVNVASLEAKGNKMETELAQALPTFSQAYKSKQYSSEQIRALLKEGEAAIEIIRYEDFQKDSVDLPKYAVLVIKNNSSQPAVIELANGDDLEKKYFKYYRSAINFKLKDEMSYTQYWSRIAAVLGEEVKHVYLSMDGVYNQININTLQDGTGTYIIDKIDVSLLASTRDLIESHPDKTVPSSAVLLGYPYYGDKSKLEPLPGTRKEVDLITSILEGSHFKPSTFLEKDAGESQLKRVSNPGILHIATHGFFREDVSSKSESSILGFELKSVYQNPLLRSGLMLAFSDRDVTQDFSAKEEDGILTAFEAMNLSLNDTRLVVLSACETGLGEIRAGEGVFGLQRAFQIAGSDAVIISLWKVDDTSTQILMTNFYREWLKSGNLGESFAIAQKKIREQYPEPYYWGAFVLIEN